MNKYLLSLTFSFISLILTLPAQDRRPSYPYISGNSFRDFCDFQFDELNDKVDLNQMKYGSTVYLPTHYLSRFFKEIHPHIPLPYILVTHNSDDSSPGDYIHQLEDSKLIAWFGQNISISHTKLHAIPIGIANREWPHGNIKIVKKIEKSINHAPRDILLYMNFSVPENPSFSMGSTEPTYFLERKETANSFKEKSFCTITPPKEYSQYLIDLSMSKFVLSPRGNGLDCHRTWEALLMGAIPIVKESTLDPMYENLPVLIVKDWNEVTEDFLRQKYEEISSKNTYQIEKIYFSFWANTINNWR